VHKNNTAFRFGTPEQRVMAVNFDIGKNSPKLIGCHSNVRWATVKLVFFIIHIHISTEAENVVEIGLVFAEIFSWICLFLPSHPKKVLLLSS